MKKFKFKRQQQRQQHHLSNSNNNNSNNIIINLARIQTHQWETQTTNRHRQHQQAVTQTAQQHLPHTTQQPHNHHILPRHRWRTTPTTPSRIDSTRRQPTPTRTSLTTSNNRRHHFRRHRITRITIR